MLITAVSTYELNIDKPTLDSVYPLFARSIETLKVLSQDITDASFAPGRYVVQKAGNKYTATAYIQAFIENGIHSAKKIHIKQILRQIAEDVPPELKHVRTSITERGIDALDLISAADAGLFALLQEVTPKAKTIIAKNDFTSFPVHPNLSDYCFYTVASELAKKTENTDDEALMMRISPKVEYDGEDDENIANHCYHEATEVLLSFVNAHGFRFLRGERRSLYENKLFDVQLLRADMIAVPSSFSEDEAIRSIRAAYKCASIHLESKGIDLLAICIRKITETPSSLEKVNKIIEYVLENTDQMGMETLHKDDNTDI